MLAANAKSAKIGQNEFSRFPLKKKFSRFSALSAFSGLLPNYAYFFLLKPMPAI